MDTVTKTYDFIFTELSDPRVHNWPLIAEPWSLLGIISMYLYSIYVLLPSYMADKKPYHLKEVIAIYNTYQVVACSALVYYVATSGWTTHYTLGCQPVDYTDDKMSMRMANLMWWHMMLKLSELIETVFFVLRKNYSQISGLHVYHHVSTLVIAWIVCKYVAGGMSSLSVMLNSSIHILMYTYYLLASLGPEMQQKLQAVKSKLTVLQIIQLCIIFIHSLQMISPSCQFPNTAGYIYLPTIGTNIILFLNFYMKSYSKKKTT